MILKNFSSLYKGRNCHTHASPAINSKSNKVFNLPLAFISFSLNCNIFFLIITQCNRRIWLITIFSSYHLWSIQYFLAIFQYFTAYISTDGYLIAKNRIYLTNRMSNNKYNFELHFIHFFFLLKNNLIIFLILYILSGHAQGTPLCISACNLGGKYIFVHQHKGFPI